MNISLSQQLPLGQPSPGCPGIHHRAERVWLWNAYQAAARSWLIPAALFLTPIWWQVNEAAEAIYGVVDPEANLIFGAVVDPTMDKQVSITLIATGLQYGAAVKKPPAARAETPPRYIRAPYQNFSVSDYETVLAAARNESLNDCHEGSNGCIAYLC